MIVDQKAGHQPGTKDEENQSDSFTQESSSQCSSYIRKALLSQEPERSRASLVAQREKNLPATWETWVQSLGWEDPLEKGMATHSSNLAWRIPWTEEPGGLQSMKSQSQT